jgi:dihydropteroate synthase
VLHGARLLRVHDVAAVRRAVAVAEAIGRAS